MPRRNRTTAGYVWHAAMRALEDELHARWPQQRVPARYDHDTARLNRTRNRTVTGDAGGSQPR